jgi:hypothetical protein
MAREIEVGAGDKKRLREMFGCSHVTVKHALRGFDGTLLARRIRKSAKEMGGREVVKIIYAEDGL